MAFFNMHNICLPEAGNIDEEKKWLFQFPGFIITL